MALIIPLSSIQVSENRIRREFPREEHEALIASISSKGLLHAPVVEKDGRTLIAGERRFRAIADLALQDKSIRYNGEAIPLGSIPVVTLGELSKTDYKEAELEENITRLDISWLERATAIAEIHSLRQEIATENGTYHSISDTSEEIFGTDSGSSRVGVRDAITLVEAMKSNPEIAKAATQKEAVKIVEKQLRAEQNRVLAETWGLRAETLKTPHVLKIGDMFDILPTLRANSFECIIADPPYGMDADQFGSIFTEKHNYKDSFEYATKVYKFLAEEGYRLGTTMSHMWVFHDIRAFPDISRWFRQHHWKVWEWPLIWNKNTNFAVAPLGNLGPQRTYEGIIYANKGSRPNTAILPDVLTHSRVSEQSRGAEKPVSLLVDLIRRTCLPGERVLDPCCGTGNIFLAGNEARVDITCVELDPVAAGVASSKINGRIADMVPTQDLTQEDDGL